MDMKQVQVATVWYIQYIEITNPRHLCMMNGKVEMLLLWQCLQKAASEDSKPTSNDRVIRFRIDALLHADPAPEPVVFDSQLEPSSNLFKVNGEE